MLVLRPTPALARRLSLRVPAAIAVAIRNPYLDWCVHTFGAARRRYVLASSAGSLLCVVLPAEGLVDRRALVGAVRDGLRQQLGAGGRVFFHERFIAGEEASTVFRAIRAERLLRAVEELASHARWFLQRSDLSPAETAERLNRVPMAFLRGRTPADVFPELAVPTPGF